MPHLFVNEDLRFMEMAGTQGDVMLANSVFTHRPAELFEEYIASLETTLKSGSVFFATFAEGTLRFHAEETDTLYYSREFFVDLCDKYGYSVDFDDEFPHPLHQTMMRIR